MDNNSKNNNDWISIKKTKKKPRNKPVSLNEFISSTSNGNGTGNGNSEEHDLLKTEFIRMKAQRPQSPQPPTLTPDEKVLAESLRTYFAETIRRIGPAIKTDSPKLLREVEQLDQEAREILNKFPTLAFFLCESDELALIDGYVCVLNDHLKAKSLIIEHIVNNANNLTIKGLLEGTKTTSPTKPTTPKQPATNPWATTPKSDFPPGGGFDPSRQAVTPPKSTASTTNNNHSMFGSITQNNGGNNVAAAAFGITHHMHNGQNSAENLNKSLNTLTKANADLIRQIHERDRKIEEQRKRIESLERQLQQQQDSGNGSGKSLNGDSRSSTPASTNGGDGVNNSQLVIQLQKRLDSEKLNSLSLRQQLDIERIFSNRLAEKAGLQQQQQQQPQQPQQQLNGSQKPNDSLGLQGLLSVASNTSFSSSLPAMASLSTMQPQQPPGFNALQPPLSVKTAIFEQLRRQFHSDLSVSEFERHWKQLTLMGHLNSSSQKRILLLMKEMADSERGINH